VSDDGDGAGGLVLLVVIGVALAGGTWYMHQGQQDAVREHEPVEATVLSTSIDRTDEGADDDREVTFSPVVAYEYEVDGETYRSTTVRPAGMEKAYDGEREARAFLAEYEPGQQVTAYYDPAAPDEAFLVRETTGGLLRFTAVGALAAVLGVGGLLVRALGL